MERFKLPLILTGLFLLLTWTGISQELHYRIMWKGDSIGYVTANQFDSSDLQVYSIESKVSVWFLGTKKINNAYHSIYSEGILVAGKTLSTKNGVIRDQSDVSQTEFGYHIYLEGNSQLSKMEEITNSIARLYHHEPNNIRSIFSERYGKNLAVSSLKDHHYSVEKPNGRSTEYTYKDGICERVEVDNFFTRVEFERVR